MSGPICLNSSRVLAKDQSSPDAYPSPERFAFLLALFIICTASVPIFLLYSWINREKYSRLRVRRFSLVMIYPLALLYYAFSELLPEVVGIINFPCGLQTFLFLCVMPSIGTVQVCRNSFFLITTRFSRATYIYGRVTAAELLDEDTTRKKRGILYRIQWTLKTIVYGLSQLLHPEAAVGDMSRDERRKTLFALRFLRTRTAILTLFFVLSSPLYLVALIVVVTEPVYLQCTGCRRSEFITYLAFAEGVIYISFGLYVSIRARRLPDQFGMLREGRVSLVWTLLAFLGFILTLWAPVDPNGAYDHQLLITIGMVGAFFTVSVWQVLVSRKFDKYANTRKNRIESKRESKDMEAASTGGLGGKSVVSAAVAPRLTEVLSDDVLKKAFEQFLVSEFTQESLFFLFDTHEWRRTYYDVSQSARTARAKRIVGAYVNPEGLYAINIPDARDLSSRVQTESDVPIDIFDEARDEVARLLESGSVMRFRSSPQYKDEVTGMEVAAAVHEMD